MLFYLFLVIHIVTLVVNSQETCINSITESSAGKTCSNQIIFADDFNNLDLQKWRNSIKISSTEEEEFVVYNDKPQNMYIKDGKLFIRPTLMPDDDVTNGEIDLKKCTGRYGTSDCYLRSVWYNIIPPVETAQISTKDFNFKYGKVEIRAKLPSGDWIYPQLWLESKYKEYGQLFNSGRIIIASTHGNQELISSNGVDISNKVLKTGFVLGAEEKVFAKSALYKKKSSWSDEFHNFTFIWKPDSFTVLVDGEETNITTSSSIINEFNFTAEEKQSIWPNSSSNSPFDKNFCITLGLAVGGIREFPDGSTGKNLHKKPWKNIGNVKRMLNFWNDRNDWYPTWANEDSALQVDYVKVTAL